MINRWAWTPLLLTAAACTLAAGCDSSSKSSNQANVDCSRPAVQQAKAGGQLPTLFPTPRGITYGAVSTNGPATVIHAYSSSSRLITFDLYKRDLASKPYQVSQSRYSDQDAEIDFQGNGVSGQVAVLSGCQGVVPVNITLQQAAVTGQ